MCWPVYVAVRVASLHVSLNCDWCCRYAPVKLGYAIRRYRDEGARLFSVLESQLADGREWLVRCPLCMKCNGCQRVEPGCMSALNTGCKQPA